MATDKLWGGRFSGDTDATVEVFTASEHVDRRLAEYDIAGSRAHALMLKACGIISEADCHAIIDGLDTIAQEIAGDHFEWSAALEDVHAIEHAHGLAHLFACAKRRCTCSENVPPQHMDMDMDMLLLPRALQHADGRDFPPWRVYVHMNMNMNMCMNVHV